MAFYPKKWLGQNFLTDKNIARKIAEQVEVFAPGLIIEIGPGKGVLTEFLLQKCDKYVGIEIDADLAEFLQSKFGNRPGFQLIKEDFLKVNLTEILEGYQKFTVTVVGNIPYNITSPILFKLFENTDFLYQAILMMQKEVAERIVARPGNKTYGLLSIYSQIHARVHLLFSVPAKLFSPRPQVDSAVVKFVFKRGAREQFTDFDFFRKLVNHCFRHRRKMLRKSLSMLFDPDLISKLPVDLTRRPEQLSVEDWQDLVERLRTELKQG